MTMEKTIDMQLKEQRSKLIESIAKDFERYAHNEIKSDEHSYNDCAVIAKMWLMAAHKVRTYNK